MSKLHILLLNAFNTGSHASWAKELAANSKHNFHILTLPGFHWKWRMHGASIEFYDQLETLKFPAFDVILCTDMMDLALFKALTSTHYAKIPKVIYFHENQISYPWSPTDPDPKLNRDKHYGFINYTSALVADQVLFNSEFHKTSFLESLHAYLKELPDYNGLANVELIRTKSKVLAPGISENIQITATGTNKFKNAIEGPVILWNHRWEYDKNPHAFFKALEALKRKKISFGLIVVGESFKSSPAVFKEMKPLFMDEIIHWGFVESRIEYNNLLAMADLIPICSIQEFFGLSMMEAIQSEIYPILPNRLVYPEHIPGHLKHDYIYDSDEALVLMLENWIKAPKNIHEELISYSKQYLWKNLIIKYDDFFTGVVL